MEAPAPVHDALSLSRCRRRHRRHRSRLERLLLPGRGLLRPRRGRRALLRLRPEPVSTCTQCHRQPCRSQGIGVYAARGLARLWTRVAPRTAVGRAVPVLSTPVPHILSQTTLSQTTLSHPISDHRPHTRILSLTQTIGHTRPHILRISEFRVQSTILSHHYPISNPRPTPPWAVSCTRAATPRATSPSSESRTAPTLTRCPPRNPNPNQVGSSKAFNVKIKSTTSMPSCLISCNEDVDSGNSNLHQVGRKYQVCAWCTRPAHLPTGSVPQVVVRIRALLYDVLL